MSAFFERIRDVPEVVVDLETTGLDWEIEQVRCIGINYGRGNTDNAVIAVDFFRRDGTEERLKPLVRAWLESRRHRFIGQNRKFDCHFLRVWCGAEDLAMDWDDTYVMAYLLNEDTTRGLKNLEALASIYCGLEANYKEKFLRDGLKVKLKKQADFWKVVSSEVLYLYCAADVWVTRRVRDALLDRLRLQPGLLDLYYGHYLPLQSAILEAERVGFYIDQDRAQQVNTRLTAECDRLIAELRDLADDPTFNVRSLPQLQTLLFDRWSLPQVDGRSTKEAVLETLLGRRAARHRRPALLEDAVGVPRRRQAAGHVLPGHFGQAVGRLAAQTQLEHRRHGDRAVLVRGAGDQHAAARGHPRADDHVEGGGRAATTPGRARVEAARSARPRLYHQCVDIGALLGEVRPESRWPCTSRTFPPLDGPSAADIAASALVLAGPPHDHAATCQATTAVPERTGAPNDRGGQLVHVTTSAQRQRQRLIRDDRRVRVRQTVDGMLRRRAGIGPLRQRASDDRHRAERCGPEGIRINGLAKWAPPRVERLANAVRAVPGRQRRCRLSTAPWTGQPPLTRVWASSTGWGCMRTYPARETSRCGRRRPSPPQAWRRSLRSVPGPTRPRAALSVLPRVQTASHPVFHPRPERSRCCARWHTPRRRNLRCDCGSRGLRGSTSAPPPARHHEAARMRVPRSQRTRDSPVRAAGARISIAIFTGWVTLAEDMCVCQSPV